MTKSFSKMSESFYILTNTTCFFSSSISLPTLCVVLFYLLFFLAIHISLSLYLIVVLMYFSLTVNNVEHFFKCLFAIHVPSLIKIFAKIFYLLLKIWFYFCWVLSSLCTLDTSHLADMWFAEIFPSPIYHHFFFSLFWVILLVSCLRTLWPKITKVFLK